MIEPETVQERIACEELIRILRQLRLIGLNRHCVISLEFKGREVTPRVGSATFPARALPAAVDELSAAASAARSAARISEATT